MNNPVPERIIDFIKEHHLLSLATSKDDVPYITSCFYTYSKQDNHFIFTSDVDTRHAKEILNNEKVAAAIALETKTIGKIRGLQITGKSYLAKGDIFKKAKLKYLKAFPFAVLKSSELWILEVEFIKMTDNRLGFGKKLIWNKI